MTGLKSPHVLSGAAVLAFGLLALGSGGGDKKNEGSTSASASAAVAAGCSRDTDCKGNRICVAGECKDAPAAASAAKPVAPAATAAPAANALIVNPPVTHQRGVVRSGPSATAGTIASLDRGTTVEGGDLSKDGQWRKIHWTTNGGGDGWMHIDVLSAPGAAPKPGKGTCSRENQWCLVEGVTAGICMDFGGLTCATPTKITHSDGCGARNQGCVCANRAHGTCDLGAAKEGLYCHCD